MENALNRSKCHKTCLLLCIFAALTPLDVPEILQSRVDRGSITAPADPSDVVALVKQYMLTPGRAARAGMVPVRKCHGYRNVQEL